ncbi:MAG: acyloxyacyl hydrolase [Bacteroidetes bacterium]|nr:acyloxyacyl hydrolase [Bacteroidota bacterium]
MLSKQGYWFLFLLFVFSSATPCILAQDRTNFLEGSAGYGKMIRNYPDFPTIENPAVITSVKFSRHFDGYKPWHRFYNFPKVGVNLTGGSLGNNSVLGHFAGLMSEFSFEKKLGNSFFWAPRLAMGVSWFSKPYNEFQNPANVVIGSAFTFLVSAEAAVGYELTSKTDLLLRFTLLHASNSHYKLPNVGMNLPAISIGARYYLSKTQEARLDTTEAIFNKKPQIHARVALGINELGSSTTPVNGPKYAVYLGSVYVAKLYSPINKVSAGIEAWYNTGVYDFIVSQDFYETKRHTQSMAVALVFGHEFLIGHFGLVTTLGLYIYNPFYKDRLKQNEIDGFKDKLKSYIPARLGFQYYLKNTMSEQNKNLFIGLYIKSNFGQADFLESSIGYMF